MGAAKRMSGGTTRERRNAGIITGVVLLLVVPALAGAAHDEGPEFTHEVGGAGAGAGWFSLAVLLPPGADVEFGLRAADTVGLPPPWQAGAFAYDDSERFHAGFTTTVPDAHSWGVSLQSGRNGPSGMYARASSFENGTVETAMGFHNGGAEPRPLHVVLWWAGDVTERAWFVRATGFVDVTNATLGAGTFLYLEEDFEAHVSPYFPAVNEATGFGMMQWVEHELSLDVHERLHADFTAWSARAVCVDSRDVGEILCVPHFVGPASGASHRAWVNGPEGASTYAGPPGMYSFHEREYERLPYACADAPGGVCAGERDAWFARLMLGGADAPLAAFD